jgi:RNA polymerase sigma factor (sigma-70 family)
MERPEIPSEIPDSEVVLRVRGGDVVAYAELVRRHQQPLRCALSYFFHSPEEIEEQLQAAFVQAFLNLKSFDIGAAFYPWLKAIALNGLRMELRRQQNSRLRGADYLRYLQLQRLQHDGAGDSGELRIAALRQCLQKLPAEDATLVQAKYADERPIKDLAADFSATEGALKVRLLRLRNILRLCIEKQRAGADAGE